MITTQMRFSLNQSKVAVEETYYVLTQNCFNISNKAVSNQELAG
jgi:hypothetical protein